jgi:transcriptional regulator with AAA-type ATPase domain
MAYGGRTTGMGGGGSAPASNGLPLTTRLTPTVGTGFVVAFDVSSLSPVVGARSVSSKAVGALAGFVPAVKATPHAAPAKASWIETPSVTVWRSDDIVATFEFKDGASCARTPAYDGAAPAMTSNDETVKVAPKTPVFWLVYSLADRATVRVVLDPDAEVVFGRSADSGVVTIDDPRVSRRHAAVQMASGGVTVRDLGSSNGTIVCGETLRNEARRVRAGDVFEVGPMRIVVAAATAQVVVADPTMRKLHAAAQRVARRGTPVLLLGEPGVGKKVIAERIHDASPRAEKPFVVFHCGSVPGPRAEEELFGVHDGRAGLLETARRGTLLLADLELLPLSAQRRLLPVLRAQTTEPVRAKPGAPDVRLLASSSRDLRAAVDAGQFDDELYALVSTLAMKIPPLRERTLEIPVLADHLLRQIAEPLGIPAPSVTPEAAKLLCAFPWLRNIGDLRDVMEYALALSDDGRIGPAELPASFARASDDTGAEEAIRPQPSDAHRTVLRIASGERSFRLPPAQEISLARRGSLWRLLVCLAEQRDRQASVAISADELFAAGWPGDKSVAASAEARVRTSIWMLRRMGLRDRLVTRDDGYLLAPEVTVEWQ